MLYRSKISKTGRDPEERSKINDLTVTVSEAIRVVSLQKVSWSFSRKPVLIFRFEARTGSKWIAPRLRTQLVLCWTKPRFQPVCRWSGLVQFTTGTKSKLFRQTIQILSCWNSQEVVVSFTGLKFQIRVSFLKRYAGQPGAAVDYSPNQIGDRKGSVRSD